MGFSLTENEIKQLCIKKVIECTGLKMKPNHIYLLDYDARINNDLYFIDFRYYNPYVGEEMQYHINWDRNEIVVTNLKAENRGEQVGGFIKHNGRY